MTAPLFSATIAGNLPKPAWLPQGVAALKLKGRVHALEAQLLRAHTRKKIKFTLPGPMTIVDTVADLFYGDRVKLAMGFAELLNQEALAQCAALARRRYGDNAVTR